MLAPLAILAAGVVSTAVNIDEQISSALATAGLTPQTARFDPGLLAWYRRGEFATPLYAAIEDNPWRAPFYMSELRLDLAKQAGLPSNSLASLSRMAGFGSRRTLLGDPIADLLKGAQKADALGAELAALSAAGYLKGSAPSTAGLPKEVAQAAALVLSAELRALTYRKLAFANIDLPHAWDLYFKTADEGDSAEFDKRLRVMRGVDLNYLEVGAHDLACAVQTAKDWVSKVGPDVQYNWSVSTNIGKIDLSGGGASVHKGPSLLVIDTGGDDTYLNVPSTPDPTCGCSVSIDTSGSDKYLSDEALAKLPVAKWDGRKNQVAAPGPAGAVFGYAVLVDTQGNDLYRSARPALGSGAYGVGILLDLQGNDNYDSYENSEGYGEFGAGILEDCAGDDHYFGFAQVQGAAFVEGVGYLVDRSGNDVYSCNDTTIDFPSPQSDKHNGSMGQGAATGYRRDYIDDHSLAGGIGLLYDQGGDDSYACGVFGQGAGYWEGVGALWDDGGNDTYLGQWYVQGAGAHFAVGYLEDREGDDQYTAMMNMAQGAGHDFSIGYLIDDAGNDVYKAPNLSLGAGNDNGIGLFVDVSGADRYETSGITLGQSSAPIKDSPRERALTLGVFLDLGGQDTYPSGFPWAKNAASKVNWSGKQLVPQESQLGVFVDR